MTDSHCYCGNRMDAGWHQADCPFPLDSFSDGWEAWKAGWDNNRARPKSLVYRDLPHRDEPDPYQRPRVEQMFGVQYDHKTGHEVGHQGPL